MNSREAAIAILMADIASGKATKRSLGVMYALIMAGSKGADSTFWRPINMAIIEYGGGSVIGYLEGVKKVAHSIFETVGKASEQSRAA